MPHDEDLFDAIDPAQFPVPAPANGKSRAPTGRIMKAQGGSPGLPATKGKALKGRSKQAAGGALVPSNGPRYRSRRNPGEPDDGPTIEVTLPKLKKFEACAALVEVRKHVQGMTDSYVQNFLEEEAEGMKKFYRDQVEHFARWLSAIEMAATALTR